MAALAKGAGAKGGKKAGRGKEAGAGGVQVEAVARDLSALGDEARLQALLADAPELLSLLRDLQDSLGEVRGARGRRAEGQGGRGRGRKGSDAWQRRRARRGEGVERACQRCAVERRAGSLRAWTMGRAVRP